MGKLMGSKVRSMLLCALLLTLPSLAAAQCVSQLTVQSVLTQDTSGNNKTTFAPGEPIRFAAQLNNAYGATLLAANGTQITITTSFFSNSSSVNIPAGISTWTWNTTVPSQQANYTVTVSAFNHVCGFSVSANATFTVGQVTVPLPDLSPTAILYDPADLIPGNVVFFDSGVQNSGTQGTGVFNVRWFVDGESLGYGSHDGVPANSTVLDGNSQFFWEATEGIHTITFAVDVDNQVMESDESNNSRSVTVMVTVPAPPAGGELKESTPRPGFVMIQNGDAGPGTNGQSVILVAPKVNNNQEKGRHNAFLNNVVTNGDCYNPDPMVQSWQPCFLQVGFRFIKESDESKTEGQVVWTDTLHGLGATPFNPPIPYIAGHEYFTLILYSNEKWGICAVDLQDTTTYQCVSSDVGGYYMRKVSGTDIFAENWNINPGWYLGDPGEVDPQWTARDATTYIGDVPHEWSSEILWTQDSCEGYHPPEDAVVGSLVGGARANIQTSRIPIYCSGVSPTTVGQPVITMIDPPTPLKIIGDGEPVSSTVSFTDSNAGIVGVQLGILTDTCGGCTTAKGFDPKVSQLTEGQFNIEHWCTTNQGFSWTLRVYLQDTTSLVSQPVDYEIKCEPPPNASIAEEQGGSGP